jgi:phosphate/sulfate permease
LHFDTLLESWLRPGREDVPRAKMTAVLVLARFCEPSGKLHIAEDWFRRTALGGEVCLGGHVLQHARRVAELVEGGFAAPTQVPIEVVLACHLAMGLGALFGGWRIIHTMGQRLIRLRPVDGFCAEVGAAGTLTLTVVWGIPVSTTHTIAGSTVGVGLLRRWKAVRWGVAGDVVWAWVLTTPAAALVAAFTWWLLAPLSGTPAGAP